MNKMRKVICVILVAVLAVTLSSCANERQQVGDGARITWLYYSALNGCSVFRDNETGIQYLSVSNGGTCVLLNIDGTPFTGEEYGNG